MGKGKGKGKAKEKGAQQQKQQQQEQQHEEAPVDRLVACANGNLVALAVGTSLRVLDAR